MCMQCINAVEAPDITKNLHYFESMASVDILKILLNHKIKELFAEKRASGTVNGWIYC